MALYRPAWAEIDLAAIRHNIKNIKSLLKPGTKFCAVLKADAYGHGAAQVAHEVAALGVDYIAVAILPEAISLRESGIKTPILVLGYTPPLSAFLAVENKISLTVYTKEQAKAISDAALELNMEAIVHAKIDTGMYRIGVSPQEAGEFCSYLTKLPRIKLEGAYTHFASADSKDKESALKQFAKFEQALELIEKENIKLEIKHSANSAAILDLPQCHLDMVRAGIIQYGMWPSDETSQPIDLKPAMRLKARIAMLKVVEAGARVSYGGSFEIKKKSTIATLPLGYADGFTRRLSNRTSVVIEGKRAPVIGRICMDQCMVDVSEIPNLKVGQEVLIFGGPEMPMEEIAALLDTINYEIPCLVGKRIPRKYI